FLVAYRRRGEGPLLAGLMGLLLMIAGAIVQQLRIAVHPAYFNHNALFHLFQMAALLLVFAAGRHLAAGPPAAGRGETDGEAVRESRRRPSGPPRPPAPPPPRAGPGGPRGAGRPRSTP